MQDNSRKAKTESIIKKASAVLLALALWQCAAMLLNESLLLVAPTRVCVRLWELIREEGFWSSVFYSLWRILLGFLFGACAASLLAVLSYRFPFTETLLWPYVMAVRTVPVASFIILALVLFSSSRLSVLISFLMVFPVLYSAILQGLKSTDRQLLEMARTYRLPWQRRLGYIFMPQIKPFLLSSCTTALGLAWKSGIAAEVIGIPDGSIGERLYQAKIYLATADLLAWTVVIVILSVGFEKAFLAAIRWAYARWEAHE